ncbi:DUF4396 domain-containing protein [Mycobacterium sp. SMC-14]|uniref:DUF4396 domain-containing protein n=1 Tax=Mycobacterium sp. SMC-14 TaxID=3385968 RepID=UPI00390CAE1C
MRNPQHAGMAGMADMAGPPTWVTVTGWVVTVVGALIALIILADIYLRRYRQSVPAMGVVWAITAIYAGPLALWAYCRWGRPSTPRWQEQHGDRPQLERPATVALHTIPGGVASFIGHGLAVPIVMGAGMTIAGRAVWPMILLIAVFALPLLTAFEYHVLALSAGDLTARGRLWKAVRISVPAVLAFDVGMGAVMMLVAFVLHYGHATMAFWLLMWVGMWLGFVTAYPIVWRMTMAGSNR